MEKLFNHPPNEVFRKSKSALKSLSIEIDYSSESEGLIQGSTQGSILSWGENIEVKIKHMVREVFSDTFKIEFPKIKNVYPLVLKRHDLVHRNGKTKEQKKVETDYKAIEDLINEVTDFVKKIADSLGLKKYPKIKHTVKKKS